MTSAWRSFAAFLILVLVSLFVACGSSAPAPIAVTLSPSAAQSIDQTQTLNITASVANDSQNAGVTWSLNGNGTLSNQTTTSATYVAPTSGASAITVTVTATSVSDKTKSASLQITVNPLPSITTQSVAAATAGTAYSATITASGGSSPFQWSIVSGALPAGIALGSSTTSSVTISGTPTGPGTNPVEFKVVDKTNESATQSITVTYNPPPPLTITTAAMSNGAVGTGYNQTLVATGGLTPYTWSYTGSLPPGLSLNASTGAITGTPTTAGTFSFTAKVTDSETPAQSTTVGLSIIVIPQLLITTSGPLPQGVQNVAYSGASLQATGGVTPYTWSWSGNTPPGLSLNASTGAITGTPTTSGTFSFTAKVTDSGNPQQTATANLSLTVNPPLAVTTSTLATAVVSSAYSQTLQASGGISPYSWSISAGSLPAGLSLNSNTGAITGTPTTAGTFNFTAKVTDSESPAQSATANLSITVNAQLAITTTSLSSGAVGVAYSQTLQATGGITPYTWSYTGSLPPGLSLSASTGVISGTPTTSGTFSFTAKVTDSENPAQSATANLNITINAQLVIQTTGPLPQGVVNTAYPGVTLQATGGVTPYTWSYTGNLPPGLSLSSSTGAITGTPTATGTFSFTAKVTDSGNPQQSATANFSITINSQLAITTTSLANGVVSASYNQTLQATGGITPYTWSYTGNLPPGLSLNASTGAITGTPTSAGTFNFTAKVTDSESPAQSVTANLSITVIAQLVIQTSNPLPQGVINTQYAGVTLQAAGGVTPYSWSISAGNLPPGLSLNSSTGLISGTPTATGTYNFTAKVTDSGNPQQVATQALTIIINGALQITTTQLPSGVLNQSYSASVTATGGIQPYSWTISAGSLPAGLSLNGSTGQITGTPTALGTSNFTVKVTDSESPAVSVTANLSITINNSQPLQVTTTGLPTGVIGAPYNNAYLQATGGTPPYTWSISAGSLPPGLSLTASTGQISGTPTTTGTYNFTAKVVDSSNPQQSATANLSITINPALTITTTSVPGGTVGTSYNQNVQASGGVQPYNWSILNGSLPPGLSLSTNNNVGNISGIPTTTGTYNFTIQVTDNDGDTASEGLSISISQGQPLAITTTSLPGGDKDWYYNSYLNASGGVPPYTWSVQSGSLPGGISLNSQSGDISGSPTATGTSDFTIAVTDSENPAVTATASLSIAVGDCGNNANLNGHYAFSLEGWDGSSTNGTSALGSFVANGSGVISGGSLDYSNQTGGPQNGTFTGTYCVDSTNLALLTITLPPGTSTLTLAVGLDARDGNGHIITYDPNNSSLMAGLLRKQTPSDFSTSSIDGNYAFGLVGADQQSNRFSVAGQFNSNGSGTLSGEADYDDGCPSGDCSDNVGNTTLSSSTFDVVSSSTGRATASMYFATPNVTLPMVFYVVSSSELLMMTADNTETPAMIMAGDVLKQSGTFSQSSMNGVSVIEMQSLSNQNTQANAGAGFVTFTDSNSSWSIDADQNQGGTMDTLSASGTYNVSSNGRMTLTCSEGCNGGNRSGRRGFTGNGSGGNVPVFYLVADNQAFLVGTDNSSTFGTLMPQTNTEFTLSSFDGNYLGGSQPPQDMNVKVQANQVNSNGDGSLSGVQDQNYGNCEGCGPPNGGTFAGSYALAQGGPNGKYVVSANGVTQVYLYMISTTQFVVLPVSSSQNNDSNPSLSDFHQ